MNFNGMAVHIHVSKIHIKVISVNKLTRYLHCSHSILGFRVMMMVVLPYSYLNKIYLTTILCVESKFCKAKVHTQLKCCQGIQHTQMILTLKPSQSPPDLHSAVMLNEKEILLHCLISAGLRGIPRVQVNSPPLSYVCALPSYIDCKEEKKWV